MTSRTTPPGPYITARQLARGAAVFLLLGAAACQHDELTAVPPAAAAEPLAAVTVRDVPGTLSAIDDADERLIPAMTLAAGEPVRAVLARLRRSLVSGERGAIDASMVEVRRTLDTIARARGATSGGEDDADLDAVALALGALE